MPVRTNVIRSVAAACAAFALAAPSSAAVATYGDPDILGTGVYASDPTLGATLEGLIADVVTFAPLITFHGFPFSPGATDHPGTDQIYVGLGQSGFHDGYSGTAERLEGPQLITLDFSALIPAGHTLVTLTLGIAADDFQQPTFGQAFVATLNGLAAPALTDVLNGIDQGGPVVQYFTIGLDPSLDNGSHQLTLAINQLGDGGDGWAIDFLTVGVTTRRADLVPEPAGLLLAGLGLAALGASRRRR